MRPAGGSPARGADAATAPSALLAEGLIKRYGRHTALDGLDLEVRAGECFALVGVNGAGKTTCIKALLDFCALDGGQVRVFGVASTSPAARARLAYLPERFAPPYYLTGHDFLSYAADLYGHAADRAAEVRMLEALDLDPAALARPVRALSKGMAQKLGLAACFLSGRELLVLDEPMSGLDPKARLRVKGHLRALQATGRTIFFTTHLLADVGELCDRMVIVHAGRTRFAGTPSECCERFARADLEQAYLACIEGGAGPGAA